MLWGRRNTANKSSVCGAHTGFDHTGFAPSHSMYAFLVYTAQAPGCSTGELSKAGPGLSALPRSKPLRFRFSGTPQRHRLSSACVLCPSQVHAAQVTRCLASALSPGWAVHLITSPFPAAQFPGCTARVPSQVCCVSPLESWSLAATLLVDVNCPGSQEDLVSNWEPAHSLVNDAVSGAEIAPCQLWLLPACLLPLVGDGPVCSQLDLLWLLLSPLFGLAVP